MPPWLPVLVSLISIGFLGLVWPGSHPTPPGATGVPVSTRAGYVDASLAPAVSGRPVLLADDRPFFPIGVTYHFTRHRDTWEKDLAMMAEMGLNTVRVDLAWRDIVPYWEGNYQFAFLEDFLDRAAKHGLYVVPVFSYSTLDYNTPWWFWVRYHGWRVTGADGSSAFGDYPSFSHPEYRRLFSEYLRQTVRHIRDHPAILAYQVMNEPHYPKRPLGDYNQHAVAEFGRWSERQYETIERLNVAWLVSKPSFNEVVPPRDPPVGGSQAAHQRWQDWREFTYENLASYVARLSDTIREEDPGRAVLVAEMSWWWWGEQPITGVSPTHIYRGADIVGFDVYPEGGQHADYYGLNSDLLLRLWDRPVWVTELNRKDGNPTSAEIQAFTSRSVERGATGIFYFQWRDFWLDGGTYGLLDSRGNPKPQYEAYAATVAWLNRSQAFLLGTPLSTPNVFLVWPSDEIAVAWGAGSPAHGVFKTALDLSRLGLKVGLLPTELVEEYQAPPGSIVQRVEVRPR